jgi:hypothetical protein
MAFVPNTNIDLLFKDGLQNSCPSIFPWVIGPNKAP